MRKALLVASVLLLLPATIFAQEYAAEAPRATVFGGYSYLRNNSNGFNGWNGQATFNFNRFLGVTADFTGDYRTLASSSLIPGVTASANQHLFTYMFGPTVTGNFGRSAVFAHALFGQAHSSLGGGVSLPIIGGISTGVTNASAFAMAFGGGIDIGISKHWAIRAAQVDYLRTQFNSTDALSTGLSSSLQNRQNSFRYAGGIVFRF